MATNNPREIQDTMKAIRDGSHIRELVFQPETGEILVAQAGEKPSPDAVRATQMAEEGFFNHIPQGVLST